MPEFKFFCPSCGQHIRCDTNNIGSQISCPICQQLVVVPRLNGISDGKPPVQAKRKLPVTIAAVVLFIIIAGAGLFLFLKPHGKPAGLVAWWPAEGNAEDRVGHHNGALQGGVGFARGQIGQAFLFNGPDAAVKIPASSSLDVGAGNGLTVECWINPSDLSQAHPIVEWNTGNGSWGVHFYIDVGGAGNLYANIVDSTGSGHVIYTEPGVVTGNIFQHVALTYNETTAVAKMYCDGKVVLEQRVGKFKPRTTYDLYLGRRLPTGGESYTFAGLIDEASIYNRALSDREIKAIHNAGRVNKN
jgi:hypothetical protein